MYSRCDPGMGQPSMGWAPFCQVFEKLLNIPHAILTSQVMCGLRGADSTKPLHQHLVVPLKLREQNTCACPTHTDPKDGLSSLSRSFSTWRNCTVHELLKQDTEKMAPTSSENTEKLSDREEIHWNPWQHLLLSVTEGCSVEGSLRRGTRMDHARLHFLHVGKRPLFIPITHFYIVFTDHRCNTSWLVAFSPITLLVSKRHFTCPQLSILQLFTYFLHWLSWDGSIVYADATHFSPQEQIVLLLKIFSHGNLTSCLPALRRSDRLACNPAEQGLVLWGLSFIILLPIMTMWSPNPCSQWNKSNIQSNCSGSPPIKFLNSPRLVIHTLTMKNIFLNAITPLPVMVLLFIKKTIDNHCWCRAGGVINPPYQTRLRKLLVTHNSFSFQIIFKHSAHCMEADP